MKLSIVVESKNIEDLSLDKEQYELVDKRPCDWCLLGHGLMCVDRRFCRWFSDKEIYVKVDCLEI